jgi:endonuclease/exonuclease/phosphatase family metal-dependent hydrolase
MSPTPVDPLEPRRLLAAAPVVSVMTQNLYYGGGSGLSSIASAFTDLWRNVQSSQIPQRAAAIAAQIRRQRPDLVALQEAVIWRTGSLLDSGAADEVEYDFAAEVLSHLRTGRARYKLVSRVTNADWEVPVRVGSSIKDLRMTDQDVILARVGSSSRVKVLSDDQANYRDAFSVDVPVIDREIEFTRGWASIEAKHKASGQRFRFINTHLEVFSPSIQQRQARELLSGPAAAPRRLPVLIAGDFNSDASTGGSVYRTFTGDGFKDAWAQANPGERGSTCCHDDDLRGGSSLEARIDLVLYRGRNTRAKSAELFGDEVSEKTPSGLWPSDHAGLFSRVRIASRQ